MSAKAIIYIVDDDEGIRRSLTLLMKSSGYPSQACSSAEEFLDCYQSKIPGCLLLDVRMPGMNGLELQQRLVDDAIHLPVIFMTGHGELPMAVKAMKLGAHDFIEKPFANDDLLAIVDTCIGQGLKVWNGDDDAYERQARLSVLSPREREIALELVDGKQNKQIASSLDISVRTVEAHRAKIMKKLQLRTLPELTRLFLT